MARTTPPTGAPPDPADPAPSGRDELTLPLIEEQVNVSRERVSAGAVRVSVQEYSRPVPVALTTFNESVQVERVLVEREVEQVEPPWQDGDVLVVPVYEERVVVQRRLVLKEEWRIRRECQQQQWTESVELRREEAHVERREAGGDWHADDSGPEGAPKQADPVRGDEGSRSFPDSQRSSR